MKTYDENKPVILSDWVRETGRKLKKTGQNSKTTIQKPKVRPNFVDLKSDFGAKRVFGQKNGENDLKHMLNALMDDELPPIESVDIKNTEVIGTTVDQRNTVFDIFFLDKNARYFNFEMQMDKIHNMFQRAFNYTCRYHSEEMIPGKEFKHNQTPIISVVISNFIIHEGKDLPCIVLSEIVDKKTGTVTLDSTKLLTIELPKFNKNIDELESEKDVYLYLLVNMEKLTEIPPSLDNEKYRPIFERARIANFTKNELKMYNAYYKQVEKRRMEMDYVKTEGMREGKREGEIEGEHKRGIEVATDLLQMKQFNIEDIAKIARIPIQEIKKIQDSVAYA